VKVLVTGGGGFLGSALTEALAARGDTAIAFDAGYSTSATSMANVVQLVGDVTDAGSVFSAFAEHRPERVIHCAAIVGIMSSRLTPTTVLRTNIEGSANIFEAARINGVCRVVHISSEEVYGRYPTPTVTEDSLTFPVMPYGVTKLAVEHLSRSWRDMHGLDTINLRISWVYGARLPRPRIPRILVEAAVNGKSFHLSEGADTRIDHTYVDDFVAGALGALDFAEHPFDTYNLATGQAPTVAEMVAILREIVPAADISVGPGLMQHTGGYEMPAKGALDSTRAHEVFGYTPRFDLRTGLEAYVAALRAHASDAGR
jgi:UDP-glucose 4-epimerase